MALTNTSPFPQGMNLSTGVVTAAATVAGDTPSNTVKIFTAGSNGSMVTAITAIPRATAAANVACIWISLDAGTTKRLWNAVSISADNVAVTDGPLRISMGPTLSDPLFLPASAELYFGVLVADPATVGWVAIAIGRDM